MRCQTSPDYALYRYGDITKHSETDFATSGGLFHTISSALLFWQDDRQSCLAADMIPIQLGTAKDPKFSLVVGSLSRLWPLFQSFCLSQFVETLSCAVQGRQVQAETGMTVFEHSLAFAEAEAMISMQLGIGPFGALKASAYRESMSVSYASSASAAAKALQQQANLDLVNTPSEVLLIGLISSMSHLSSHLLAIFGLQSKLRLPNTGFWGLCFMSAFIWSFYTFSPGAGGDVGILRFPTVCIVGFIPHLLILIGICICMTIYALALTLSAFSLPPGVPTPSNLKDRFLMAHENLQANVQLSSIRISMHEDFYTTLLKIGFMALTAASEAVYLNEGRAVGVKQWTWLEENRMNEVFQRKNNTFKIPRELNSGPGSVVADGVGLVEENEKGSEQKPNVWQSGYARERSTQKLKGGKTAGQSRMRVDGVGATVRGGRWLLAFDFFKGIFWLMTGWLALALSKALAKVGVSRRPRWLSYFLRKEKIRGASAPAASPNPPRDSLEFWLLSDEGILSLPQDEDVDVEHEMRRRLQTTSNPWTATDEAQLESQMYNWFVNNGWWGSADSSGSYRPPSPDIDTTSIMSLSTNAATDDEWESESSSGRRTPTQSSPFPSREQTPLLDSTLDTTQLARLLDPKGPEQRCEARLLASHLASDRTLTRSRYRQSQDRERARILTTNRAFNIAPGRLGAEDEAEMLEQLILSRRSHSGRYGVTLAEEDGSESWANGAAGLGAGGPQCVVCQSSPRTILVWPCRCLSLCEDCRVSLAMNNFGNCVCCRRDVVGFSRIWVP